MMIQVIFQELAQRWGVEIPADADAIQVTDHESNHWQIEISENASLLTVFTTLLTNIQSDDQEYWLKMNADRERMNLAWIGQSGENLILGASIPLEAIDAIALENLVAHLKQLKSDLFALSTKPVSKIDMSIPYTQYI